MNIDIHCLIEIRKTALIKMEIMLVFPLQIHLKKENGFNDPHHCLALKNKFVKTILTLVK